MPTYVYRREDGTTFEIMQKITEPALESCPTTGQAVKRVIGAGAGIVFKGSGFYQTDYVRKPKDQAGSKAEPRAETSSSNESTASGSESTTTEKADS